MSDGSAAELPIEPALPALRQALAERRSAVLQAPPGAGKTTRVPLDLLGQSWLGSGKIVMLEPRRIAARAAARRMAALRGEAVGETVGYRVRLDTRVGPRTRIEVVTDGVFTRLIQADPGLAGVGAVLFDEFHERSLDADLGLALCLEVQRALRPDLRLLVMSATLDGAAVAALLGDAPVVRSDGRAFPVETRHLDRDPVGPLAPLVAETVRRALREEAGSLLVFLPGIGEIRRVAALIEADGLPAGTTLAPLYGDLSPDQQDEALRPAPPGRRKIVLATAIAETSLTIEGVRVVVDGGLMRVPRFDPVTGMSGLATVRVSRASADQRRGRAGRLEPGVCYRLWTAAADRALAAHGTPEIAEADLAPLVLELALWGVSDPARLSWITPPPAPAWGQARDLLTALGALDAAGRITAHGRAVAGLGAHPRLAHMMLRARERGQGGLACDIAALLGERDILRPTGRERDVDLRVRLDLMRAARPDAAVPPGQALDRGGLQRARETARQWRRQLGAAGSDAPTDAAGLLVALAYPDRLGRRRPGSAGTYRLAGGRGAALPADQPLAAEEFLAVAELDAGGRDARIFLAAPVRQAEIETEFADRLRARDFVEWDGREGAVRARRQTVLDALVLADAPLPDPDPAAVAGAMTAGIRALGLDCLPWTPDLRNWCARVMFLRRLDGESAGWPDVSPPALLATLEAWLTPFLAGVTRRDQLRGVDLAAALGSLLAWPQRKALDDLAPTHAVVPTGSRVPLDYTSGATPVLAVRIQEMFGARTTPTIAGGRVALVLHLLSPAHRPVQITADLAGFWATSYRDVKRDLMGRYPRHPWPDDPVNAAPTRRTKPRT